MHLSTAEHALAAGIAAATLPDFTAEPIDGSLGLQAFADLIREAEHEADRAQAPRPLLRRAISNAQVAYMQLVAEQPQQQPRVLELLQNARSALEPDTLWQYREEALQQVEQYIDGLKVVR